MPQLLEHRVWELWGDVAPRLQTSNVPCSGFQLWRAAEVAHCPHGSGRQSTGPDRVVLKSEDVMESVLWFELTWNLGLFSPLLCFPFVVGMSSLCIVFWKHITCCLHSLTAGEEFASG